MALAHLESQPVCAIGDGREIRPMNVILLEGTFGFSLSVGTVISFVTFLLRLLSVA